MKKNSYFHIISILVMLAVSFCIPVHLFAQELGGYTEAMNRAGESLKPGNIVNFSDFNSLTRLPEGFDAAADSYEVVGNCFIARGNAVITAPGQRISADKVIVNLDSESYDLEAVGHVTFSTQKATRATIPLDEYLMRSSNPNERLRVIHYVVDIFGTQGVEVETVTEGSVIRAERAAGSMITGAMQFYNFGTKSGKFYCVGERAERSYDGRLDVYKARFSTCEYMTGDQDHYALATHRATIRPREAGSSTFHYSGAMGDHSILMWNPLFEVYGLPIFWLPAVYKPSDISSFGGKIEFGSNSDWGWYIRSAKHFKLLDDPYLNANVMVDYYNMRGPAFGFSTDLLLPDSSTEFSFYNVFDRNPYMYWDRDVKETDPEYMINNSRLEVPHYRFEIRTNNLTHITRRLDFRMQIDLISDYNYLRDFDRARFGSEYQPPTYASLEYQGDRFTASTYLTVRINDFYSTVDRLPELRLSFHRQELFANVYYQGETSLTPAFMRWRRFQRDIPGDENWQLKNYSALRFDTLHMFYYPIQLWNINIIPRAGIRLTAYSKSSEEEITLDDLATMATADRVDGIPSGIKVKNYDSKGGAKFRVAGEFGVEVNTRFYRAWNNVKSGLLNLDGLRHIMIPYVNYNFLPRPTVNADNLYYFDEIDRISEQHFVRIGMTNRLQTRRGNAIHEWMSMENYWTYYIANNSDLSQFGQFGTVFKSELFEGLTLSAEILLNIGNDPGHDTTAKRGRKDVGRPGIDGSFIDRLNAEISYKFAPDWRIYANYKYTDDYYLRNPYSMGSSLSVSTVASSMVWRGGSRTQTVGGGLEFPMFFDKDFTGSVSVSYDIESNLFSTANFRLMKKFHCWYAAADFGFSQSWHRKQSGGYNKHLKHYLGITLGLTAMPAISYGPHFSN